MARLDSTSYQLVLHVALKRVGSMYQNGRASRAFTLAVISSIYALLTLSAHASEERIRIEFSGELKECSTPVNCESTEIGILLNTEFSGIVEFPQIGVDTNPRTDLSDLTFDGPSFFQLTSEIPEFAFAPKSPVTVGVGICSDNFCDVGVDFIAAQISHGDYLFALLLSTPNRNWATDEIPATSILNSLNAYFTIYEPGSPGVGVSTFVTDGGFASDMSYSVSLVPVPPAIPLFISAIFVALKRRVRAEPARYRTSKYHINRRSH